MSITININGTLTEVHAEPDTPLLWVLRDELGMTGTKFGCGVASCGACTVHIDGVARRACVTPISTIGEGKVTSIEGINDTVGLAVQSAWRELDVVQCGYCQSGQIMSAISLLSQTPKPSDEQINEAMDGNVCRCATYHRIRAAIHRAAETLEG